MLALQTGEFMKGRIYYFCYDHNRPTGGQKHTYEHVDILQAAGMEAFAVHREPGLRLTWFENDTPVKPLPEVIADFQSVRDYWVLPEDLGPRITAFPGRKVIFN